LASPYAYSANLKSALLRFKYVGARTAARDLAPLLAAHVAGLGWQLDGVVGVPLHPRRQQQRGFNQADALAAELSRLLGLPQVPGLQRVKDTEPQARQPDRHARRANMQAAFQAQGDAARGKRVLVIDDVCTTGATLSACAQALRAAGAAAVYGATLARAL
jgi:ComF family protein